MKEITFVRHAKSSWEFDVSDLKRPLKKRGRTDADLVSSQFHKTNYMPNMIYSSPAKRAHTTCEIFVKKIKFSNSKVDIVNQLYDFGGAAVVDFIKSLDNKLQKVMIFGHNHAFTSIVNSYGTTYIDNLPTCGLVTISFDIDNWKDLNQGKTILTIFPRDLK